MIKLTISAATEDDLQAFIKSITYPVRRIKRPPKRPENTYYKAYMELKIPLRNAGNPCEARENA